MILPELLFAVHTCTKISRRRDFRSHECHHLYINVLLRTLYHRGKNLIYFLLFSLMYNIQNCKLCFLDMKIMPLRNDGDSVNNSSCGLIVY